MKCTSKPPDLPTFFLDKCLGKQIIAKILRKEGTHVEIHDDHFLPNAKDKEWLPEVGKKEWIVLTKDKRIRHRTPERIAVIKAKVGIFTLLAGDLQGSEMANIFLKALPAISRFIKKHKPPFIVKISRSGKVEMLFREPI